MYYNLFTIPFDQEYYRLNDANQGNINGLAYTYDQLLKERDYTLYNYYKNIVNQKDPDEQKRMTRDILNELVYTLSYYIYGSNVKYVLSFISTNSFDSILNYISLMINFFKSWKVQFLAPKSTFELKDKKNNLATLQDSNEEMKVSYWNRINSYTRDSINIRPHYLVQDYKSAHIPQEEFMGNYNAVAEVVDLYLRYSNHNIFRDRDYDGGAYRSYLEDHELIDSRNGELLVSSPDSEPFAVFAPTVVFAPTQTMGNIVREVNHRFGAPPNRYMYDPEGDVVIDIDGGEFVYNDKGELLDKSYPYYEEDGGVIGARNDVYMLDGAGAGLLSFEEIANSKNYIPKIITYNKDGSINTISDDLEADPIEVQLVNLPDPSMSDSCVDIDGGGVGILTDGQMYNARKKILDPETLEITYEPINVVNLPCVDSSNIFAVYNDVYGGGANVRDPYSDTIINNIDMHDGISSHLIVSPYEGNGLTIGFDQAAELMDYGDAANGFKMTIQDLDENALDIGTIEEEMTSTPRVYLYNGGYIQQWENIGLNKENDPNGLNFADKYVKLSELNEFKDNACQEMDRMINILKEQTNTLYAYTNDTALKQIMDEYFYSYFANSVFVLQKLGDYYYEAKLQSVIDGYCEELKSWMADQSPFINFKRFESYE